MKLKTAKILLLVFTALMVLLLLLCSFTKQRVFGYLGIVSAFSGVAFWLLFGRCPCCGKFLGRTDSAYCPHCGHKIDR